MLEGKSMTPHQGNTIPFHFSKLLPRLRLVTPVGLFELTRHPSRAFELPCALLPELQRYKDTVRCAALGMKVPGNCKQQLTQTLIVGLLKTYFLHRSLIVKSQQQRIELVTRPGHQALERPSSASASPLSPSQLSFPSAPLPSPQSGWEKVRRWSGHSSLWPEFTSPLSFSSTR